MLKIILFVLFFIVVILVMLSPLFGATGFHFHKAIDNKKIRVACVGDSITNGALIPGCFFNSYPSQLQKLLGDNYQVENFGLNGRTLQKTGDLPYIKEKEYQRSLEFNPNIVMILLGANDSKPNNWKNQEAFKKEYKEFLEIYKSLESKPRIIIGTPPWERYARNWIDRITNDTIQATLIPIGEAVKEIAKEESIEVIDFYKDFENKPELISYDGAHPNKDGAALIAKIVYKQLKDN